MKRGAGALLYWRSLLDPQSLPHWLIIWSRSGFALTEAMASPADGWSDLIRIRIGENKGVRARRKLLLHLYKAAVNETVPDIVTRALMSEKLRSSSLFLGHNTDDDSLIYSIIAL